MDQPHQAAISGWREMPEDSLLEEAELSWAILDGVMRRTMGFGPGSKFWQDGEA